MDLKYNRPIKKGCGMTWPDKPCKHVCNSKYIATLVQINGNSFSTSNDK